MATLVLTRVLMEHGVTLMIERAKPAQQIAFIAHQTLFVLDVFLLTF
jgi:hypothetical protein